MPRHRKSYSRPRRRYFSGFRRHKKMTIPLAPIMGLIGTKAVGDSIQSAVDGNFQNIPANMKQLIGINYSNKFDAGLLIQNMTPLIAGLLIHKFVGGKPLNLNQTLSASGVPYVRI